MNRVEFEVAPFAFGTRAAPWGFEAPGLEEEFRIAALPSGVREVFATPHGWFLAVRRAIAAGWREVNQLTNIVFFMHHPERVIGGVGLALDPSEPRFAALSGEWKVYRTLVQQQLDLGTTACAYFFKGADYVRYDIATNVVDVGPVAISRNWPALPVSFQRDLGTALNWTFPNDLAGLMRSAGLAVNEVANWRTNGRPGGLQPIGIVLHHTAGNNDLNIVVDGRPDLRGPLANFYVGRNAQIHVVSGGRANHAGFGAQRPLDEVQRGVAQSDTAARRGLTDGPVGNGYFYGFEPRVDWAVAIQ